MSVNPFLDDIVDDPRRISYSLPGFNQHVVDQITERLHLLLKEPCPRYGLRSPKSLLVMSPRAGFGKSHLIGQLFRAQSGKSTLVYIKPYGDPETAWKSILTRMGQELDFPDRTDEDDFAPSQLTLFSHAVLAQIVADHLPPNQKHNIDYLRRAPEKLVSLKDHEQWCDFLEKILKNGTWINAVQQKLHRLNLQTPLIVWLKVLHGYGYLGEADWEVMQGCKDWLRGDPIDDDIAQRIGIPSAQRIYHELSATERNEMAKQRVLDLCRLAGFYRPFLICFDQTENYGQSKALAQSLGIIVNDLTDEAPNQLTLITTNAEPWENQIAPNWQVANRDRLEIPPLKLPTLSLAQAQELAQHRVEIAQVSAAQKAAFFGDLGWLTQFFTAKKEVSIRMFLKECALRWNDVMAQKIWVKTSLAEQWQKRIQDVEQDKRRQTFDHETLYWLVSDLAKSLPEVTVTQMAFRVGEKAPQWQYQQRKFVFVLQANNNASTWGSYAHWMAQADHQIKLICLRTAELPPVPKETWKVAADLRALMDVKRLAILTLTVAEIARLYAAHRLYTDSVQGDIDEKPSEVTEFLLKELDFFWKYLLDDSDAASTPKPPTAVSKPTSKLATEITKVMRTSKFMSLDDLASQLTQSSDLDQIRQACEQIDKLKLFVGPGKVMIQWRSEA